MINVSMDGGLTFESIGTVTLEDGQSNYEFMDTRVAEATKYVYRIDFLQEDGSRISSPIRFVRTVSGNRTFRVTNPIASSLTIDLLQSADRIPSNLDGARSTAALPFQRGHWPHFPAKCAFGPSGL